MQKQITSIFLVAGTCIGGGILALPMVLAKLGIINSLIIMALTWLLTYYSSLISVELNLHADKGLTLGMLGRKLSGVYAEIIGTISVKLLSYALLSAFICGVSSIMHCLIEEHLKINISVVCVETCISIFLILLFMSPTKIISKVNNVAFSAFLIIFGILAINIICSVDYSQIPWFVNDTRLTNVAEVITVVFTSFGYQVIFHTLRDYCGKDTKVLRHAFLIGSIIPTIVYMLWTYSTLSVIFKCNPEFYAMIIDNKVNVGMLIDELSHISNIPGFNVLTWVMSVLAIITSAIGVGLGLSESFDGLLKTSIKNNALRNLSCASITVFPAYIVAALLSNAFTKILGFAGGILVIIAILLPAYLYLKSRVHHVYLNELKRMPIILCCIIGVCIMITEFVINHL